MGLRFFNGLLLLLVVKTLAGQMALDSSCIYSLSGSVFDGETNEPLSFVNIQLDGTAIGTTTNSEGQFSLEYLCEKEYNLVFSYIGYKELRHHHDFHHSSMDIYLAPTGYALESIVVEAEEHNSSLSTVAREELSIEEIESVDFQTFGDVASQLSGVSGLKTGQNIVKPIIHGLHSNRVLVVNEGVRHEFQNWSEGHAPEIDPSAIEKLEVIKGAGTVQYGPEALGGVLLVGKPEMELTTPLRTNIKLTGQSNGQSGDAAAEISKGFNWMSLRAGGSYTKQGDLKAADYNLSNTGKEEHSFFGGIRFHPAPKWDLEAHYSRFDQNLGILSGSVFSNLDDLERAIDAEIPQNTTDFTYDIGDPKQEVQHDFFRSSIRFIDNHQSFYLQYGQQLNRRKEFGVRRSDAPNIDLELLTHTVDFEWNHPHIGPFKGKLGAQWLQKANDNLPGTNTVPFIPNYDEQRFGIFLIETVEFGKLTLEGGLRYDVMKSDIVGREPDNTIYRNTVAYNNFSGTLGLELKLNEHASFRSNIGSAWRTPNISELYRFGQHSFFIEYGLWRYTIDDQFDFVSTREGILDENDRPVPSEKGYKWINTYQVNQDDFQFELTGYFNYIQNYIYSKPAGLTRTTRGFFIFFIYDQTDAVFWGADLSTRLNHSARLHSTLKGSYLWSRQVTTKDHFVAQPPPQLTYQLNYTPEIKPFESSKFQLTFEYNFEQRQHPRIIAPRDFLNAAEAGITRFTEDANDFDILAPPPAYLLTNFRYTGRFKSLGFSLGVNNLFNIAYRSNTDRLRYFADDLGRNFIVSLSWKL